MTPRRKEVLETIRTYRADHDGISPTLEEIAAAIGISRSMAYQHCESLVAAGELIKTPGKRRGYTPAEGARVKLVDAQAVVDQAFEGKTPQHRIGGLHGEITTGLRSLPAETP